MDPRRFDGLVRAFGRGTSRRGALGVLAAVAGLALVTLGEETGAAGRRKRRQGRHHPGEDRDRRQRRRKGKDTGKGKSKSKRDRPAPVPAPPPVPGCTPTTCAAQGKDCGSIPDGCGGAALACGTCPFPSQTCSNNVCSTCVPACAGKPCGGDDECGGTCTACSATCPTGTCSPGALCDSDTCQPCTVTCPTGTCVGMDLQAALNGGGPVYVCAGRYTGNFTMTADVEVIGAGQGTETGADPAVDTILDAQDSGRVVTIPHDRTVTLRHLRITGGSMTDADGGAGIFHLGTLLQGFDCTITDNHTNADDSDTALGAISNHVSTMALTRCTIRDNSVANAGSGTAVGGGILNDNQLTLTDCVIRDNTAKGAGGGLFNVGSAHLIDCRITENLVTVPVFGGGGGIGVLEGSVTLTDSFVWDNTAPDCAGNVTGSGCGVTPP